MRKMDQLIVNDIVFEGRDGNVLIVVAIVGAATILSGAITLTSMSFAKIDNIIQTKKEQHKINKAGRA